MDSELPLRITNTEGRETRVTANRLGTAADLKRLYCEINGLEPENHVLAFRGVPLGDDVILSTVRNLRKDAVILIGFQKRAGPSSNSPDDFPLRVMYMDGKEIDILAKRSWTVAELKSQISTSKGKSPDKYRLSFKGMILADEPTLSSIDGLEADSIVVAAEVMEAGW